MSRSGSAIPDAIRPWQHVLNPLSGYLRAGAGACGTTRASPAAGTSAPIPATRSRCATSSSASPSAGRASCSGRSTTGPHPHEAGTLLLDSGKAHAQLGWAPAWGLDEGLDATVAWYAAHRRRRRHARDHAGSDRGVLGGARVSAPARGHHRRRRPGRLLPRRAAARRGLRRRRARPPGRRSTAARNLDGLRDAPHAAPFDLLDHDGAREVLIQAGADEIYHLAAPTFVPDSWQRPDRARWPRSPAAPATVLAAALAGDAAPARLGRGVERGLRRRRREPAARGLADAPALALRRRQARRARAGAHDARAPRPVRVRRGSPTTTSRRGARRTSCRARSRAARRRSRSGRSRSSCSATSTRCATGATRATSCAPPGWRSRRDEPGDYVIASGVGRTVGELVQTALRRGRHRRRGRGPRARRPRVRAPAGADAAGRRPVAGARACSAGGSRSASSR